MEIKSELKQPYTENERLDFIVEQNYKNGYEIKETENSLEAWGYTEEEKQEQEREFLNKLSMTRGDMFEAIILAFGKTKADIRSMIENVEGLTDIERALYLNRFDEALDFYRGYPAVDLIGQMLGVSSEQLDKFFEFKDYKYLIPNEPVTEEVTEETDVIPEENSRETDVIPEEVTEETDVITEENSRETNVIPEEVTEENDIITEEKSIE